MLCVSTAGLAALMLWCALVGLAAGEVREGLGFLAIAVPVATLSLTVILLTDPPQAKARARDGLAFAILLWLVFGAIGSLPFLAAVPEASMLDALYESVSSLTTTGHSLLFQDGAQLSATMLMWRVVLHLVGTGMSIVIAASVFAAINLGGPGVHRTRFYADTGQSFFSTLPSLVRIVASLILGSSALLIAILLAWGVPPREALAGAVSAISTGIVDPSANLIPPSGGPVHSLFLSGGLFVGTFGLLLLDRGRGRHVTSRLLDPEVQLWAMLIGFVTLLALTAGLPLLESLAWATTSLATSGMALGETTSHHRLPLVLVLFPALIGGSALSAAGGIKLARLFVLLRRVVQEFVQLGYRGSVQHFSYRGLRQSEKTVMGVWVYLVGYVVACTIGTLLFSLTGLLFDDAIKAAIGTLSNAGHLLSDLPENVSEMAKLMAIPGMLLGRLEVIALLPALSLNFWQK